jgi:hypothetical protein
MTLQHMLKSPTNDTETINIQTLGHLMDINGKDWSMTFHQNGLVTQVVIQTPDGEQTITLKVPTYREVRQKVKENGRSILNPIERAILDTQGVTE